VPAPHCPGGRHGRQICCKTQNAIKTQLLASNYCSFLLKNWVTFGTRHGLSTISTHHIEVTSCVKLRYTTIGADELTDISSYQTLPADKKTQKVINLERSSSKKLVHFKSIALFYQNPRFFTRPM
jgi:hypothetical protein